MDYEPCYASQKYFQKLQSVMQDKHECPDWEHRLESMTSLHPLFWGYISDKMYSVFGLDVRKCVDLPLLYFYTYG